MSFGRTDRGEPTRVPGGAGGSDMVNNVRTASGLNVVAGIWLILAPFILGYSDLQATMWNSIIVGVLILAMAAYRVANPTLNPWVSWVVAILGVWLILSPFIYGHSEFVTPFWNDILVGIVVLVLGAWSALAGQETGMRGTTTRPTP